jgi:hypothetical protein
MVDLSRVVCVSLSPQDNNFGYELHVVPQIKAGDDSSPEDSLINELDTIDLHHGIHSADPPYTVLEVIGAEMIERVKAGLSEFGFNEFQTTEEGFRAVRPLPSAPDSGS